MTLGSLRLRLLGGFELLDEQDPVSLPMSVQRLIAFVALRRHPVLRTYAAGSLWTDASDRHACASLRSALWRLRRHGPEVVETDGRKLRLSRGVRVDLHEAEALARQVLDGAGRERVGEDLSGLREELLPDWYDDWVLVEREAFHQLRLRALESLCDRLTQAGRLDEALSAGLSALEGEPLRESAHRALVRVHLAQGNASEAIRQYGFCRRLLRDRLGLEPSAQMLELMCAVERPAANL